MRKYQEFQETNLDRIFIQMNKYIEKEIGMSRYVNELRQRIVAEYSICGGYDYNNRKEIDEIIGEYNDVRRKEEN